MAPRFFLAISLLFTTLALAAAQAPDRVRVEIDLQEQMAYLIEDGAVALATPISSGRAGHLTETGVFKVIEKERNHYSTLYGKIVDARGRVVVSDADADMKVPRGGRFIPAPMRYFMRFSGATGMHAGYLPGYAASHGCVRLPENDAIALFNTIQVGTPVTVFGRTTTQRTSEKDRFAVQPRRLKSISRNGNWPVDRRTYFAPQSWWQ